jgi:hypothetical protein
VSIFVKLFGCLPERYGDAVVHVPRVRVVAVQTAKLAAGCPRNHANTRPVDGGASGERMKKAHIPRGQRGPHVGFGDVPAQVHAQVERAFRLQRSFFQWYGLAHKRLVAVKSAVDHVHLLLTSQAHEVDGIS